MRPGVRGPAMAQGTAQLPASPPFLEESLHTSCCPGVCKALPSSRTCPSVQSFPGCCGHRSPGEGSEPGGVNQPSGVARVLGRWLCPTISLLPSVQHESVTRAMGQSPCRWKVPLEMDSVPTGGQSPWRRALTRWPQSCPCPSPRSSGHGQPWLQAALRRSNNNLPGS